MVSRHVLGWPKVVLHHVCFAQGVQAGYGLMGLAVGLFLFAGDGVKRHLVIGVVAHSHKVRVPGLIARLFLQILRDGLSEAGHRSFGDVLEVVRGRLRQVAQVRSLHLLVVASLLVVVFAKEF